MTTKTPLDDVAKADNETLDAALRRAPNTLTDADLEAIVAAARRDRALFVMRGEEKAGRASPPEEVPSE